MMDGIWHKAAWCLAHGGKVARLADGFLRLLRGIKVKKPLSSLEGQGKTAASFNWFVLVFLVLANANTRTNYEILKNLRLSNKVSMRWAVDTEISRAL